MTQAELKRKSKEQIQGHIPKLFLCMLVLIFLSMITQIFPHMGLKIFISIILFLIYPAMEYSLSKIFLCVVRKEEFTIKDFFKNIFDSGTIEKAFYLSILQGVYVLVPSLLFILLEIITIGFILTLIAPIWGTGLVILLYGLPIFVITIYVFSIPYSISYYILIDNPNMTAKEVLKESKSIMRGHKLSCVILKFSFIGWFLLSIITCGLAYIYAGPYYEATITNFYESIKNQKAKTTDD